MAGSYELTGPQVTVPCRLRTNRVVVMHSKRIDRIVPEAKGIANAVD